MKKNKIIIITNSILALILLVVASVSVYAWYLNQERTSPINISSNGVVLSYTIDQDEQLNVNEYTIENLVFFDIDNENEGKYFSTMVICMRLDITNKTKKPVDITVSMGTEVSATDPYVACVVTNQSTIDSTSATGSVTDYLTASSLTNSWSTSNVAASNGTTTCYVYIYGVQPKDDATNEFVAPSEINSLISKHKYNFRVIINAGIHVSE